MIGTCNLFVLVVVINTLGLNPAFLSQINYDHLSSFSSPDFSQIDQIFPLFSLIHLDSLIITLNVY